MPSREIFHPCNYLTALLLMAHPSGVKRFGENVKRIREARGLSQEDVARRLGRKRQGNLSRLENGDEVPSPKRIRVLAVALECDPSELLEDVETEYDRLRLPGVGKHKRVS